MRKVLLASMIFTLPILADMDRCVACHGVDFEKKALGVSRVVKNMSEAEIKEALDRYKRGEGGPMKEVMIKEVNVGVDTDAMAADVYNEIHTPGFEEPDSEFIFKKRRSVRGLHKIKMALKDADKKKYQKLKPQIKSFAFDLITYDKQLRDSINFDEIKPKNYTPKEAFEKVVAAKKCVDHSFKDEELHKCQRDFVTLAAEISLGDAMALQKKIKPKDKKKPEEKLPQTAAEAEKALVGTWSVECAKGMEPNTWMSKEVTIDNNLTAKGWMKIYADKECKKLIKEIKNNYTFKVGSLTLGDDNKEAWEVDKLLGEEKKPVYTMVRFVAPNKVLVAGATKSNDGSTPQKRKNHFEDWWPPCLKKESK